MASSDTLRVTFTPQTFPVVRNALSDYRATLASTPTIRSEVQNLFTRLTSETAIGKQTHTVSKVDRHHLSVALGRFGKASHPILANLMVLLTVGDEGVK